ncbi:MAG: carbon-nitrogen hydrolase family protein [Pseudomonadota bacterium]
MMRPSDPKPEMLSLLACQILVPPMITVTERDAHLARTVDKVRAAIVAADTAIDLVVLPELSSLEYATATFDHLEHLAEPLEGPSFQAWRAVAIEQNVHVCYGFARREGRSCFISMAVVGPDGRLSGHYDKMHLAQFGASGEKVYFERGERLFTFRIKDFILAPIICYDIRIPEMSRALVLDHGVDVILHCGAYFRDESFATWHSFAITRALENQVYLMSLNRAGAGFGRSLFCPPWQDENTHPLLFSETDEDFRQVTLDRQTLLTTRATYTFLEDRHAVYRKDPG